MPILTPRELEGLLLDTSNWAQSKLKESGGERYRVCLHETSLTDPGIVTHDGKTVRFSKHGFQHAFMKSDDFRRAHHVKTEYCRLRVARIDWIVPIIAGQVAGTTCVLGFGANRRPPRRSRAYLVSDPPYVVRLWEGAESKGSEWWFETAYPTTSGYVRKQLAGGVVVASW